MPDYKTPFSDAVSPNPVPKTSSGRVGNPQEVPDTPGRDGSGLVPEVTRDTHWKGPSDSGPYKTPFKDAV